MATIIAAYGYLPPASHDNLELWRANGYVYDSQQLVSVLNHYFHLTVACIMSFLDSITLDSYHAPENLLQDRTILVTGAGEGIGRAAAKAYAAHGATVLLLGRTLGKLEQVYDEIEASGHAQPAILPINMGHISAHDYIQLAQTIEQEIGQLDGILHNAANLGELTPLQMYDTDTFDQVLATNLSAPFMLTQAVLPLLRVSPDASVIFTSSSVGREPRAFWGPYAISKLGLEGLSQIFSAELANVSKIRFNTLNPGATRTNMRAHAYPGENPTDNPLPEQIMDSYLYLMGPDSAGITGKAFNAYRPE